MTENTAAAEAAGGDEGGFADLLADLETLAKSKPDAEAEVLAKGGKVADEDDTDANIEEAAEEAGAGGEGNQDQADADPDDEEGETFGKSFEVVLADGTRAQALDGTAMMKALHTENVALRAQQSELGQVVRSMGLLIKSMHGQQADSNKLIKSLSAQVSKLGNSGAGRKAVLHVQEKGNATPAAPAAPNQNDIMAKAQSLLAQGKLTGGDVNRVFTHTSRGLGVPSEFAPLFTA